MTRLEIAVQEIVVRGLPASLVSDPDLGALVEDRLAQLARGEEPPAAPALVTAVADGIWAEVRRATTDLGSVS